MNGFMAMTVRGLARVGYRLARAREQQRIATQAARTAASEAARSGISEAEIARQLGVTRMTVRAWLGK